MKESPTLSRFSMDTIKAFLLGTLFTIFGFGLSFLFLHIGSMIFFGQSAVQFLQAIDVGRVMVQQQYAALKPDGWVARILADKMYFSLISLVVLLIWGSNVYRQLNKEDTQ